MIRQITTYIFALLCIPVFSQELPSKDKVEIPEIDLINDSIFIEEEAFSKGFIADSILSVGQDNLNDSIVVQDTTRTTVLEAPITYNASDSIVVSLDGQKVYLYNEGVVNYQTIELKAHYIELNLETNEVYAEGVPDTTGVMQGEPIFRDGEDEFECKTLRYSFESQKGIIEDVKTQQGEGFVHSERTKKIDADAFILKKGKYTTCDHDHPHFYLHMSRAKVISNKKIITGPAWIVIEDFPIYFPFLPFGFFPNSPTYSSGIIIPTYGEEQRRGFFLRQGGYYWAASQYFDLTLLGDIYSKGSWGSTVETTYKKRYKFNGNLSFQYNVNKISDPGLPDYQRNPGFSLRWSHSQDSKANPFQTFSASVNLSTSSFDRENSYNVQRYLATTKSSSISYSKKWENTPFNMSANFRHSQNSRDTTISLSFPEITFSMSKIYPFKKKSRIGKPKWYEKIGVAYTGNIKNSINTHEDELFNKSLIRDWKNGWKHSIPISLPNFSLLNYINITPNVSYSERWYTNKLDRRIDLENEYDHISDQPHVVLDTLYGFFRNYDYSFSVSSSTNIYGMFTMKNQNGRLKAIRHKMTPSVSFAYRPDFGDPRYGFYGRYINEYGEEISYNRFKDAVFGSASEGESASMSFSLANNIEAKIAAKNDTTGNEEKFEKIKILDNLSFNSSYDFIKDSLKLSPINIRGRTSVRSVNINFGGTINPYMTDSTGTRTINQYAWSNRSGLKKLGRLTNANLSFGMSFKSKQKDRDKQMGPGEENENMGEFPGEMGPPGTEQLIPDVPFGGVQYADFSIPWDFRFDYTFSYSKRNPFEKATINQSLNFSGSMKLTNQWNMRLTTNFDVQAGEFSFTTFNVNRKLHCWNMAFNFVPFGQRKSYSFTINASSAMLKDLKIDKNRSWFDN